MSRRKARSHSGIIMLAAFLVFATSARADDGNTCTDDAMLVFDASGSMMNLTDGGSVRIEMARAAAHQVVPAAARHRHMGLVTYGPGGQDQCVNIALKVPIQSDAAETILAEIDAIDTGGETPLSSAVEAAAEALDYRNRPAVIVVLTDGDENCGREPCEIARTLAANAFRLTVHIIGFKLGSRPRFAASCFSQETGGLFVPTNSMDELVDALSRTLVCPQITGVAALHRSPRHW